MHIDAVILDMDGLMLDTEASYKTRLADARRLNWGSFWMTGSTSR